jgi:hypothetical protein
LEPALLARPALAGELAVLAQTSRAEAVAEAPAALGTAALVALVHPEEQTTPGEPQARLMVELAE